MIPLVSLLARAFMPLLAGVSITVSRVLMYIFFGLTASVAWLLQFLRLDKLPESAKMILKVFFLGILITVPVFAAEFGAAWLITKVTLPKEFASILYWFLVIALIEELFKYLAVRTTILKSREFDEPVDAMIYMMVLALGFAALENILYLLPPSGLILSFNTVFTRTIVISFFRFVGATFLHALCSSLVGYFLALSICKNRGQGLIMTLGLSIAVLLHGLYNFSIMEIGLPLKYIIPMVILLGLSLFVILGFRGLKRMKSVCLLQKK